MFFDSAYDLGRILAIAPLAYVAMIVVLRVSGKRMLSKMNAFDLVVTVALGSTLSSILLSKEVSLSEGILAFALLIALQYAIAWSSTRATWFNRLVKSEPSLLVYQGRIIEKALRRENVTKDALLASLRGAGYGSLDELEALVLESDGSMSAIGRNKALGATIKTLKYSDQV